MVESFLSKGCYDPTRRLTRRPRGTALKSAPRPSRERAVYGGGCGYCTRRWTLVKEGAGGTAQGSPASDRSRMAETASSGFGSRERGPVHVRRRPHSDIM